MELIVTSGERQETLRIEAKGGGSYIVHLGDRRYQVSSAKTADGVASLLLRGSPAGPQQQWEMGVRRQEEGLYLVSAGGPRTATTVRVEDPLTHQARQASGGGRRSGPHRVTAYMPGRVIALLVEEGDEVEDGQGVLVLEAMKMENEIAAQSRGAVKKFLVEVGQTVDGGDPLFEIE